MDGPVALETRVRLFKSSHQQFSELLSTKEIRKLGITIFFWFPFVKYWFDEWTQLLIRLIGFAKSTAMLSKYILVYRKSFFPFLTVKAHLRYFTALKFQGKNCFSIQRLLVNRVGPVWRVQILFFCLFRKS